MRTLRGDLAAVALPSNNVKFLQLKNKDTDNIKNNRNSNHHCNQNSNSNTNRNRNSNSRQNLVVAIASMALESGFRSSVVNAYQL